MRLLVERGTDIVSWELLLAGLVALALLIYLVYTLLRPEEF